MNSGHYGALGYCTRIGLCSMNVLRATASLALSLAALRGLHDVTALCVCEVQRCIELDEASNCYLLPTL